jgi:hypothetical protein
MEKEREDTERVANWNMEDKRLKRDNMDEEVKRGQEDGKYEAGAGVNKQGVSRREWRTGGWDWRTQGRRRRRKKRI